MTTGMYPEDPAQAAGWGSTGGAPHPAQGGPARSEPAGHQPAVNPRGFAPPPWYSAPSAPVAPVGPGGYAPPAGLPGYPTPAGWGTVPPRPRTGMPGWAIAILCVFGALVVLGVIGAVAGPAFLTQHAKAEYQATTLALPDTINGIPRLPSSAVPVDPSLESEVKRVLPQATIETAAYRDGATAVAIILVRPGRPLNAADQVLLRQGEMIDSGARAGITLTKQSAGSLGGWFGCGSMAMGAEMCGVVDSSSLMVIVVSGQGPDAVNLSRTAREAVEHRR